MQPFKHSWQLEREMTPAQFEQVIGQLNMSQAAAARFLGRSARTANRYVRGTAEIPVAEVLLLRAMLNLKVEPIVPTWTADRNKHWG